MLLERDGQVFPDADGGAGEALVASITETESTHTIWLCTRSLARWEVQTLSQAKRPTGTHRRSLSLALWRQCQWRREVGETGLVSLVQTGERFVRQQTQTLVRKLMRIRCRRLQARLDHCWVQRPQLGAALMRELRQLLLRGSRALRRENEEQIRASEPKTGSWSWLGASRHLQIARCVKQAHAQHTSNRPAALEAKLRGERRLSRLSSPMPGSRKSIANQATSKRLSGLGSRETQEPLRTPFALPEWLSQNVLAGSAVHKTAVS